MKEEKTIKNIIENYAHDFRDMKLTQEELAKMLWEFLEEQEKVSRKADLKQFMSKVDSMDFLNGILSSPLSTL